MSLKGEDKNIFSSREFEGSEEWEEAEVEPEIEASSESLKCGELAEILKIKPYQK